jgi:predicted dithiol-disulfide oxidoreductase (DUF899 family)
MPEHKVVYRTYVTTARGLEPAMGYSGLLDRTPMGRNENASAHCGCGGTTSTSEARRDGCHQWVRGLATASWPARGACVG